MSGATSSRSAMAVDRSGVHMALVTIRYRTDSEAVIERPSPFGAPRRAQGKPSKMTQDAPHTHVARITATSVPVWRCA